MNRFIQRTDRQNTAQLFKVKQGHAEGLKAFVNRWQGAAAKVRNFDKVAKKAFVQAQLPGKFLYATMPFSASGDTTVVSPDAFFMCRLVGCRHLNHQATQMLCRL